MLTKEKYIKSHNRNNYLRQAMESNDWSDNTPIEIIGGLIAPTNKNSNLYGALQRSTLKEYVIGGHRKEGTEGWWIAVA